MSAEIDEICCRFAGLEPICEWVIGPIDDPTSIRMTVPHDGSAYGREREYLASLLWKHLDGWGTGCEVREWKRWPCVSTDPAAMVRLMEALRARRCWIETMSGTGWSVKVGASESWVAYSAHESLPMAIALAVVKLKEQERT